MNTNSITSGSAGAKSLPLICFSHLRWNFVFQRPQHLMKELARWHDVTVWEEPLYEAQVHAPHLRLARCDITGATVVTPIVPGDLPRSVENQVLTSLLRAHAAGEQRPWIRWYYTPMMLPFSRGLRSACTVYDCMDELSNFRFAPPELAARETELFETADLVFTGGQSLFEAKRHRHADIHAFPSSIDHAHFASAATAADPEDQASLSRPRLGYYGVIDERMDLSLLTQVADARSDWQFIMVGPVAKIADADLPRRANIHYLGKKDYTQLPSYLSGWDVALMPFAINDATRFISPTKTPEYLAAGRPVVSTPIKDVERDYGALAGVQIAGSADEFVHACERAFELAPWGDWHAAVKAHLAARSWRSTALRMEKHIDRHLDRRARPALSTRPARYDYLIVGAGFAGAVLAERIATQLNKRVLIIDRRPHIGGNAFDYINASGVLMHKYGPHIFHSNSADVFSYLSQFTAWRPYEHRVLAEVDDQQVPIPINRTTLNLLYGLDLKDDLSAAKYLASRAEARETTCTSEDVVVAAVGRELYEKFFRGYTRKQWGMDPSELDKSVTSRVPTRTNTDDRYFTDKFQAMPLEGYTAMFDRMLKHPLIDIELSSDFAETRTRVRYDRLIYTGPIDAYFDHLYGRLPYRSLRFEHVTHARERFQAVGTVNYPAENVPYTRVTEYKHLTGQVHDSTTITYEHPCADGDPFYPIPTAENHALYKKYETLAMQEADVHFVGRLATYRYYNMDQVVGQALAMFRRIAVKESKRASTNSVLQSSQ